MSICMEQDLYAALKGMEVILIGDLDARLRGTRDSREEDIAMALTNIRLVDLTDHFMPRRWYREEGSWKWHMRQDGRKVTGIGD